MKYKLLSINSIKYFLKTNCHIVFNRIDMAQKRKPGVGNGTNMNFRPSGLDSRQDTKGTRPTTEPTTIAEALLMMIVHVCKKILFVDSYFRIGLYMASLFLISLIGDFVPYPKTYFARSDNMFNVYFVKLGWAWTLSAFAPFLFMTSRIVCAGDKKRLLSHHVPRIAIATAFWFIWTKTFNLIENAYGRCNVRGFDSKPNCLKAGHFWNGFDISGHVFILIYSSLVLIEEARPIQGWESIREHLRNEEHNRSSNEKSNTNPLRNLKDNELEQVKQFYEQYTPYIRFLFIAIVALQLLWDVMLFCTMLYYHRMVEKVISGLFALATWFVTYRVWYPSKGTLPGLPGHGIFNYVKPKAVPLCRKHSGLT